jgi:hypothetical protein
LLDLQLARPVANYLNETLARPNGSLPESHSLGFSSVNLKTATALGLDVPTRLQQLADEVID